MTQQERIERDFRLTLGDMHVQLIVAQARIAELEAQIAAGQDKPEPAYTKEAHNGQGHTHT